MLAVLACSLWQGSSYFAAQGVQGQRVMFSKQLLAVRSRRVVLSVLLLANAWTNMRELILGVAMSLALLSVKL